MGLDAVERKLAAILSADVVGYSRLMAEDETGTVRTVTAYREEIRLLVTQHRGRIVDAPGDNVLAEYPTATDAVQSALEIQRVVAARNAALPADRKMEFRIGVHLGEVRVEGERIYGDGVNVAARLEGLAEPGGICISGTVHEQVRNRLGAKVEDLGEKELKNLPHPVRVYRVSLEPDRERADEAAEFTVPGFSDRPAIAVLALENLSDDPEQEYLADGIAEDLITRLSLFRWFPVIARNSSFVYKGKPVDVKQVSRELGVRYVVEGSLRKAGERVRISVQLIDATTGHHVWAERYDRERTDIFALQDEITEAIAGAIQPEVLRFESERAAHVEPQNLDAWDCVQRGRWHLYRFTKDENAMALSLFERAVELDPHLALASSSLALAHLFDLIFQWSDSPARSLSEEVRAAERSVVLDERDPSAQLALGDAYGSSGQWDKAIGALELAIQLNPSFALAHFSLGMTLALDGRPDDAIAHLEKTIRLSPQDLSMFIFLFGLALAHFTAERYGEAIDWARRSLQRRPDFIHSHLTLAASCGHLGQADEAAAALQELLRLRPGLSLSTVRLFGPPSIVFERYIEGLRKAGLKE